MFSLFIELLSFSGSLATKCLILNETPCIVRPTLINMINMKSVVFIHS